MIFSLFVLKAGLHGTLLISLTFIATYLVVLGYSYSDIKTAMFAGLSKSMPAMVIFLLIGIVIVTFIQSGTVPTLIYYGLKFIDPVIFLPAGLILCSLMSLATGTSWGTVGTGGIVLLGIGYAMGFPLPIVAGMIVSGATFGDKMSPVSDTTNLASISAETDLYSHIKSMSYTTAPTYLITLVVFTIVGFNIEFQDSHLHNITSLMDSINSNFNVNVLMLSPMLLLLILSFKKVPAEAAMLISSLFAAVITVLFQNFDLQTVVSGLYDGNSQSTNNEVLDTLLNRGGMVDMTWTFTISLLAIAMGSMLDKFNIMQDIVKSFLYAVKTVGGAVAGTIASAFAFNLSLGESYISIILSGQMFKEKFDKLGVDRNVLSRSTEEGSTLLTALIPWTTTGVFYYATLKVPVLDFAPWALLNWINPIIGIIFAYLGIAIFKTNKQHTIQK